MCGKEGESHVGYGVVGKRRSVLRNKSQEVERDEKLYYVDELEKIVDKITLWDYIRKNI